MSIQAITTQSALPWAEVRFMIRYSKSASKKNGIKAFMEPYKDKDGLNIMQTLIDINDLDTNSLKHCYRKMMQHASLYNLRTMIIPLFPDIGRSHLNRQDILTAASEAYMDEHKKHYISVYLLVDSQNPLTAEESDYLSVAEHICQKYSEQEMVYNCEEFYIDVDPEPEADYDDPVQELLRNGLSFSETVLNLMKIKDMTASQCCYHANMRLEEFSKISQSMIDSTFDYTPSKQTVIALAVAFELTYEESECFLACAGYNFSNSDKMDLIVQYYLQKGESDIFRINNMLNLYDQPLLGSH